MNISFKMNMPLEWIKKYKIFFFDLDGTLINSSRLHSESFKTVLKSTSKDDMNMFNYNKFKGKKTQDVFAELNYNQDKIESLRLKKQTLYRDFIKQDKVELFPYVYNILKIIKSKGYQVYLVTGSSRITVKLILKYTDIGLFIDKFVCGDDVTRSKPNPEIYLLALEKYNISPHSVLVIEDSANGIKSAVNAGLMTVSVDELYDHDLVRYISLKDLYYIFNLN